MITQSVTIDGLGKYIQDINSIPERQRKAIVAAINRTADRARTAAQRKILQQVNLTASYLNDRLTVSKKASGLSYEAQISARSRPTSLARFITGTPGRGGVSVAVKPGIARYLKRSFVFRGGANKQNALLAVRTDGGKPKGAYKPIRLEDNLWLVYGPSVEQLYRDAKDQYRPELDKETADFLESEYLRLMDLEHF